MRDIIHATRPPGHSASVGESGTSQTRVYRLYTEKSGAQFGRAFNAELNPSIIAEFAKRAFECKPSIWTRVLL